MTSGGHSSVWNAQSKNWVVAYLQIVKEDGSATYKGLQLTGTLNTKRVVETPSNRLTVLDCAGKTLDELRATGRLIGLQHTQ
jgi:hypothetical protein